MVDLAADLRPARDLDELVYGLEEPVALVAQVRDVRAAGGFGEPDELVSRRKSSRRVDQGGAHAERALRGGIAGERAHPLELSGCGGPVVVADLVHAERRRADERGDVDRHAPADEVLEALAERRPRDVVLDVRLAFDVVPPHLVGKRSHGRSFAEYLERHALPDVALGSAIGYQRRDRPGQHVDETGADREARRVYLAAAAISDRRHHRADPIPVDRDIGGVRHPALAVVHRPVAYDDVVHRAAILGSGGEAARGHRRSLDDR